MCRLHTHAGERRYLDAARPAADALVRLQNPDGGWPAYLADMTKPRIEGFVEHAMLALADFYVITGDARVRKTLDRAIAHLFPRGTDWKADPGESPLALHALGVLADKTGQAEYALIARELFEKLHRNLNLSPDARARGDLWAAWGGERGRRSEGPRQTQPTARADSAAFTFLDFGVRTRVP